MTANHGCPDVTRSSGSVPRPMTKRRLRRLGYAIKSTPAVGWWVDGAFGYLVSGYWPTEAEAIGAASARISSAIAAGGRPAWLVLA